MAKKQPVSQSKTMWVKKGTIVNGVAVPKGYLAQYGKPEKKVSATVSMVTGGQGGMGATATYKQGRRVQAKSAAKSPATKRGMGGGSTGNGSGTDTGPSAAEKARQRRLEQNKGVKSGTVRAGAAGRGVRKYNAKTGRWERVAGVSGASTVSSQSKIPKSSTATAMEKWKSLSPAQKTAARKNATQFARMMGINPSKAVLGSLGIRLNPGPAPRNPLSVKGTAERVGASYSMTAAEARKIIAAANAGNKRITKAVLDAAKKVIEGR